MNVCQQVGLMGCTAVEDGRIGDAPGLQFGGKLDSRFEGEAGSFSLYWGQKVLNLGYHLRSSTAMLLWHYILFYCPGSAKAFLK